MFFAFCCFLFRSLLFGVCLNSLFGQIDKHIFSIWFSFLSRCVCVDSCNLIACILYLHNFRTAPQEQTYRNTTKKNQCECVDRMCTCKWKYLLCEKNTVHTPLAHMRFIRHHIHIRNGIVCIYTSPKDITYLILYELQLSESSIKKHVSVHTAAERKYTWK